MPVLSAARTLDGGLCPPAAVPANAATTISHCLRLPMLPPAPAGHACRTASQIRKVGIRERQLPTGEAKKERKGMRPKLGGEGSIGLVSSEAAVAAHSRGADDGGGESTKRIRELGF